MSLTQVPTPIEGVHIVQGRRVGDARGFLERLFCREALAEILDGRTIVQINHTRTEGKGTVRGMHFQHSPASEMKLVHCLAGRIFDVAVDLRRASPTFGQWHGEELSGETPKTLVIPEGAAHGFQLLSDSCDVLYLHTTAYAPEHEDGIDACDPSLAIEWPLDISRRSDRDQGLPQLAQGFTGIEL